MPFQPCPETAEIRISAELHGQIVENVLHCRISTAPTPAELDEVKSVVNDWVTGTYAAHSSNDLNFTKIDVTDLNTASGPQVTQVLSGIHGTTDTPVKTNQDTFCLKLLTGNRGRSFRGRFYWLGVNSSAYDSPNTLSSATVTALIAALDALRIDLNTASHPLGVLSRFSGIGTDHKPIPRPDGILTDVVSVAATDNTVDSQNRRLPGRGI